MRPLLPEPCLCLVTDRSIGDGDSLVYRVAEAVAGGVNMVQLREKDLPGSRLLELAASLREAIGDQALLIVNERVDVAAAAGASGVQLGEEALPVGAARRILGPQPLIGRSVHSEEGAAQAIAEGVDFLIVGTMYATRSHPGVRPAGPDLVRRIAQAESKSPLSQREIPPNPPFPKGGRGDFRGSATPVIGIGGITAANLDEVLRAGASGVAVITSILASPSPREAARELKQAMLDVWQADRKALRASASGGANAT